MNKKERVICKLQNDLKKCSCWRFNLSNDDIIFAYVNMYVAFLTSSRSANAFGFLRPALKTGVENDIFCCEIGS